jgi:hypothetical protein
VNRIAAAVLFSVAVTARANAQENGWHMNGDARIYGGYFHQTSQAGTRGFTSSSWVMLRAQHSDSTHALGIDAMFSGDALINGECGQPRLLPSEFDCGDGMSVSHPLVMALGIFARTSVRNTNLKLVASAVGEPAFGPAPHFMRASASYDAGEPLMHHFFTPVHSAAGVITGAVTRGAITFEASVFNSRTNTDRYKIEFARLEAYAGRLSLATSSDMTIRASAAYFPAAESGGHHGHGGDMRAYSLTATASRDAVSYTAGCTLHRSAGHSPAACMLETTLLAGANVFFGRVEGGRRLDQVVEAEIGPDGSHAHVTRNHLLATGEASAGYARHLLERNGVQVSVGARGAVTTIPEFFELRYRARRATSLLAFLALRPAGKSAHHH